MGHDGVSAGNEHSEWGGELMFVLRHNETRKYVSVGGRESSYTPKLEQAQVFDTQEEATNNRCVESEDIVGVRSLLLGCRY